jgi:membrane protein required for colicin V production
MNWLDIVILIVFIAAAFGGMMSGLIKSLFSLIGLILGVVLAGRFYAPLAENLGFISNENVAHIAAFIIIFVVVMIIAALLGVIITRVVSIMLLGWLNRLLGGVFGVLMAAIFIGAILAILAKFAGAEGLVGDSALGPFLLDRIPIVLGLLPEEFDSVRQFLQ